MSVAALRFAWIAGAEQASVCRRDIANGEAELVRLQSPAAGGGRVADVDVCPEHPDLVGGARVTLSEVPTEELIRRYAPEVEIRRPLPGRASAFSLEEAQRVLGYEPEHTWRS